MLEESERILLDQNIPQALSEWPTTIEQTQKAIERLIADLSPSSWRNCLIIIDNQKIRVRKLK